MSYLRLYNKPSLFCFCASTISLRKKIKNYISRSAFHWTGSVCISHPCRVRSGLLCSTAVSLKQFPQSTQCFVWPATAQKSHNGGKQGHMECSCVFTHPLTMRWASAHRVLQHFGCVRLDTLKTPQQVSRLKQYSMLCSISSVMFPSGCLCMCFLTLHLKEQATKQQAAMASLCYVQHRAAGS